MEKKAENRKWTEKKNRKKMLYLAQFFAAGLLCFCMLNIAFWMNGSYRFWEASRRFEETELFFYQVNTIIKQKIQGQKNCDLFETNGVYDAEKQLDIQAYGNEKASFQDLNTTYRISDLLAFCENGGREKLHETLENAKTQTQKKRSAGEILEEKASELETILPVTGITLAECSGWYADSEQYLVTMYQKLDEVSEEIQQRYLQYKTEQDESWSELAPSNLRYWIENTATGECFTNLEAQEYEQVYECLDAMPEFQYLFEGERSFNMMVVNQEHMLNQAAADWFMDVRFEGSNERILLAVNLGFPVSDLLKHYASVYEKRGGVLLWCTAGSLAAAVSLICFFLLLVYQTIRKEKEKKEVVQKTDTVPTELLVTGYAGIELVIFYLIFSLAGGRELYQADRLQVSVLAAAAYLTAVSGCEMLLCRSRKNMLWNNSICYLLFHSWKQVTSTRIMSWRVVVFYLGFFVLNFSFMAFFERTGLILVLLLDLLVLLYLLRDVVLKQNIWEGIHQISKGDLTYKIDTSALQGETLEMAKAINEMGDGLQEAVQTIIKNERLKSELITNVSHDLKTPLTSIVNYVDLLKRENPPGEQTRYYIHVLEQKSARLRQLTEDLVEASRISSGNIELQMTKLHLQSLLEQAVGEFEDKFKEKKLTETWKKEAEPVYVYADGSQLWRVMENLLGNIYKYAKDETGLWIELRKEEKTAVILLQNTSREQLLVQAEELTGRFVRGDQSRSTEGSGLGLSIAQNLMTLMGGELQITTKEDQFSARLIFPLLQEAAEDRKEERRSRL